MSCGNNPPPQSSATGGSRRARIESPCFPYCYCNHHESSSRSVGYTNPHESGCCSGTGTVAPPQPYPAGRYAAWQAPANDYFMQPNGWTQPSPQPDVLYDYGNVDLINDLLGGLSMNSDSLACRSRFPVPAVGRYTQPRAFGLPDGARRRQEGVKAYMRRLEREQHLRSLCQRIAGGRPEAVVQVFDEVVDVAAELMVDPKGSELMGNLVRLCADVQINGLLRSLAKSKKLISVAKSVSGSRALQLLIERIAEDPGQVAFFMAFLSADALALMKDQDGSHVIRKCLERFTPCQNLFIFLVALYNCYEVATNSPGCVVIKRCIHAAGAETRMALADVVCRNGFQLAQDRYGNYVVQYVIDLGLMNTGFAAQFQGEYVNLSKQKYSSNVVQRCLVLFLPREKSVIVSELLADPWFDELLQDPFANYVIQTALEHTDGYVRYQLVEAIRPYQEILRDNVHAKKAIAMAFPRRR